MQTYRRRWAQNRQWYTECCTCAKPSKCQLEWLSPVTNGLDNHTKGKSYVALIVDARARFEDLGCLLRAGTALGVSGVFVLVCACQKTCTYRTRPRDLAKTGRSVDRLTMTNKQSERGAAEQNKQKNRMQL